MMMVIGMERARVEGKESRKRFAYCPIHISTLIHFVFVRWEYRIHKAMPCLRVGRDLAVRLPCMAGGKKALSSRFSLISPVV